MTATTRYLRIGELSRRTGVEPELLRAWERRYGLLRPARSEGGFRLYSEGDARRIELMRQHLREGLAAAEAARLAIDEAGAAPHLGEDAQSDLEAAAARLREALDGFDEGGAQRALDDLFAGFTVETVLTEVLLPYLAELGDRWKSGDATVAQEHFASNVIRGRLLGIARGWDGGNGRRVLLACAPGELHDIALIAFGIALHRRGWRITYLGPDTPIETLVDAASRLNPDLVVVSATTRRKLTPLATSLRNLVGKAAVAVAGPGAASGIDGITVLEGDPVGAALEL